MNLSKKTIIFFILFAVIFNSSGDFLKPLSGFAEETTPPMPSGNPGEQKNVGAAGARSTVLCIPGITAGTTKSITLSSYFCDLAEIIGSVYDSIATAASRIEAKWALAMRDIIAKRIMDYIVDQTVKWIQGGGKPKFIGNWNGFLKDVGDIAFDSVAKDLGLANLCSPFGLQLKLAFLPVEKFSQRINCSLDQFVKNIQNFYVDFSVGGWEGYMASWEMNNNFYGAYLLAYDEAVKRTGEQTKAAESEAIASKGFLGVKQCKKGSENNLNAVIANSGLGTRYVEEVSDNCFSSLPEEKEYSSYEKYEKDFNKCFNGQVAKDFGYTQDTGGDYCKPEDMVNATPGDIVGKVVEDAVGSDSRWAQGIHSWTSALVNAVINRLIQKGLSEMTSSETATPSRYYPPEYQQMVNQQKLQDDLTLINQIKPMQNEWNTLLTQKGNSLVYAREILTTLQQLQASNCTSTSGQLVTAGDIDNASSTIDNLQLEIASLQSNLDAAQSVIDQINSAQTDAEKAAASFAFNNFLTTYNTYALQSQILDGSARNAASQQSADLLKQLEGENILDPVTNQMVNNGLRTRLTQCRAPQAGGQQAP